MMFIERKFGAGHWQRLFWLMDSTIPPQDERRVNQELRAWCEDQFGPGGEGAGWEMCEKTDALTFNNLTYATAFKTRWVTATYVQG